MCADYQSLKTYERFILNCGDVFIEFGGLAGRVLGLFNFRTGKKREDSLKNNFKMEFV